MVFSGTTETVVITDIFTDTGFTTINNNSLATTEAIYYFCNSLIASGTTGMTDFVSKSTEQTITGKKTFTSNTIMDDVSATTLYVSGDIVANNNIYLNGTIFFDDTIPSYIDYNPALQAIITSVDDERVLIVEKTKTYMYGLDGSIGPILRNTGATYTRPVINPTGSLTTGIGGRSLERYRRFNYGPWTNSNISPTVSLPAGQATQSNPNRYQVNYNHIPGSYLVKKSGKYKIKTQHRILNVVPYGGTSSPKALLLYACRVNQSACQFEFSNTPTGNKWRIPDPTTAQEECHLLRQYTTSYGSDSYEYTFDNCEEGDMLYFKWVAKGLQNGWYATQDSMTVYEWGWGEDCFVSGSTMVPRDVKIVDFLKDIITLYNLYIDIDPSDPKKLFIESRDTYYKSGTIHDWTNKLDLDSPIEYTSPKDYQNYINKFRYATDNDQTNTLYNELKDPQETGYGGYRFMIDSDLAKGEKEVSLNVFAPTPLRDVWGFVGPSGKTNFVISQLLDGDYKATPPNFKKKLEWKPRILIYQSTPIYDNSPATRTWMFCRETNHITSTSQNYKYWYPYAGHIRYPFALTDPNNLDLNFDTKLYTGKIWQKLFTGDSDTITKRNQFNLYYKNQFDQIINKDSRIMTAYFYLTANDIRNIKLYDTIFVDGTYYTINKIIDFNPDGKSLTKVELLKIIDGIKITYDDYQTNTSSLPTTPINPNPGYLYSGFNNIKPIGTSGILIGDGNNDRTNSSLILGSGNNVVYKSAIISTDNSTIKSTATIINSEAIVIESGLTNVTVIGETDIKG